MISLRFLQMDGAGRRHNAVAMNCLVAKCAIVVIAAVMSCGAHSRDANAAQQARENAPSWFSTPFGIVYRKHARETVPYAANHAPGTIVVNTKERYLYFVLGEGKSLRYNIGVGKEGHAWAGTST